MPSQNKTRLYIKKVEIENCGRFYGEGHSLILSDSPEKNITIIAADSGIGKSTIHDLIYWGLYGEHKPTKKESNKEVDYGIINDDALTSLKSGDSTSGSVTISINDDVGELYELKRTITATLTNDTNKIRYEERNGSRVSAGLEFTEDVVLHYRDARGKKDIEKNPAIVRNEINKRFPQDLSDFFLFDGEYLDNFKNRGTSIKFLEDGITKISGLNIITNVSRHAEMTGDNIQNQLGKSSSNAAGYQRTLDKQNEEKTALQEIINRLEIELRQKSVSYDDILMRIQQDKSAADLTKQKNSFESNRKLAELDLSKNSEEITDLIFEKLPPLLIRDTMSDVEQIFADLERNDQIPPSISRTAIDKILNSSPHKCLCGRGFEEINHPGEPWYILNQIKSKIINDDISQGTVHGRLILEKLVDGTDQEKLSREFSTLQQTRRDKTKQIAELDAQIENLERQINTLNVNTDYDALIARKNLLKNDMTEISEQLGLHKSNLQDLESKILEIQKKRDDAIDKEGKYENENKKKIFATAISNFATLLATRVEQIVRVETEETTTKYFLESAPGADSFSGVNISEKYEITPRDHKNKVPPISKGQAHVLGLSYVAGIREISNTKNFLIIDSPLHNISGKFRNQISEVFSKYLPGVQLTLLVTDTEYVQGDKDGAEPVRNLLLKQGRVWKEYLIERTYVDSIESRTIKELKRNVE